MSVAETGCLPYMVRLVLGMPYMVTTNVDVEDGLVNGAIGELKYVEYDEDDAHEEIVKLWIKFDSDTIGAVLRLKSRPLVYSKPGILQPDWTPISRRSANIKLSSSIKCKRIQFPIVSASPLTVHNSLGGTFSEIVYDYDKSQDQQLVYVGLSRVTSLDGLYLTNSANAFMFHHARGSKSPKMLELRSELQRLDNHRLRTLAEQIMDVMQNSGCACTLMTMNVQSLQAHSLDIATDRILTNVDVLALSETWLDNGTFVEIVGFKRIIQSKRVGARAAGIAIYQKDTIPTIAIPHTIDKLSASYDEQLGLADDVGDICAAEIIVMDIRTLLISVYISPDSTTKQRKYFLTRNLMMYTRTDMPIVVTGDFNIDVSKPENTDFVDFMKRGLKFDLASDPTQATTLGGTCLDLTFTRNIRATCKRYCAYFSYHRPMLSVIEI
ncbi:uncharacterized protein LOC131683287 [Topomyia yanbarensis]|uniref:uncharacterized protein LOC131683287 n=1 Tax=Topomyia yanbarensis TaxID=2498891 RepID=UPI00273AEC90|nr:uncharacterized protein LOC131683287 [Topomyia yanbarensis]